MRECVADSVAFFSRPMTLGMVLMASAVAGASAQTLLTGLVREPVLAVSTLTALTFTPDG